MIETCQYYISSSTVVFKAAEKKNIFFRYDLKSLPNEVETDELYIVILSPVIKSTKFFTAKVDGFYLAS